MTKKDFIAIAAIIAGDYAVAPTDAEKQRVRLLTYSLADYFQQQNPLFDRAKFYAACGFE